MTPENTKGRSAQSGPTIVQSSNEPAASLADQRFELHQLIAARADLEWRSVAFMAIIETAVEGRVQRRPFLSLHGAAKAVERAHSRGQSARVEVVELRPLVGGR